MAIHGNYTETNHANFLANTKLREKLGRSESVTHAGMVSYWAGLDDIRLGSAGLTDLSGLEWITAVDGSLIIENNGLVNLDELSNLTSVGGTVSSNGYLNNTGLIMGANPLENIDGLSNLTSVAGDLTIGTWWNYYNSLHRDGKLTSLDGLMNLTTIGGTLDLSNQRDITDLSGLTSLTSIGGWLYVYDCASLSDVSHIARDDLDIGSNIYLFGTAIVSIEGYEHFLTTEYREGYTGRDALIGGGYLWLISRVEVSDFDGDSRLTALEAIDHTHFDPNTPNLVMAGATEAVTDGAEDLTQVAIGKNASVQSRGGVAIGPNTVARGNVATAIGNRARAEGGGFAMGNNAKAGFIGVAIGNNAKAAGSCLAFGDRTDSGSTTAAKCVAIGTSAEAKISYEIRLGGEVADYDSGGDITTLYGRGFPTVHPNRAGLETLDNELVSKKWADEKIDALLVGVSDLVSRVESLEDRNSILTTQVTSLLVMHTKSVNVVYDGDASSDLSGTYYFDGNTGIWSNGVGSTLAIDPETGISSNILFNSDPSTLKLGTVQDLSDAIMALEDKVDGHHPA